jgi:uncharacterized protein YjgD (DUF1641 family)
MAKPIALATKREGAEAAREELRRRIENAPLEHAEALLSLWNLLEAAHENHVLDVAQGALSSSSEILARLAETARSETSIRAMRNAILLAELLGAIDPAVLGAVAHAVPAALSAAHELARQHKDPPSLFRIARDFTSPDARRAHALVAAVLGALGRSVKPDGAE